MDNPQDRRPVGSGNILSVSEILNKSLPPRFPITIEHRGYLEGYLETPLPDNITPNRVATIFLERNKTLWPKQLKLYRYDGVSPVCYPNGWTSTSINLPNAKWSGKPISVMEADKNQNLICAFFTDIKNLDPPTSYMKL